MSDEVNVARLPDTISRIAGLLTEDPTSDIPEAYLRWVTVQSVQTSTVTIRTTGSSVDIPGIPYTGAAPAVSAVVPAIQYGAKSDQGTNFLVLGGSSSGSTYTLPLPSWTAATFTNSWTNFGGSDQTASYSKDAFGFVHLRGLIKGGAQGSTAFTLPSGYRPALNQVYPLITSTAYARGVLVLSSAGQVIPQNLESGSTFVSLAGVTFYADGS